MTVSNCRSKPERIESSTTLENVVSSLMFDVSKPREKERNQPSRLRNYLRRTTIKARLETAEWSYFNSSEDKNRATALHLNNIAICMRLRGSDLLETHPPNIYGGSTSLLLYISLSAAV